ncbi:MOS1T transposase, partial [Pseudoatta argentina]
MAAMLKLSAEYNRRAAIIEGLRARLSATEIIRFFGYSRSTVYDVVAKYSFISVERAQALILDDPRCSLSQDKPSCSPRLPLWPPNSPDLNPLDYYVWSVVERVTNKSRHPNVTSLRTAIEVAFKSAAEAHRILVQTYGDNALSDTTCRDWFRRFKNNDFELEDKERSGAPTKFQDKELEQLLDDESTVSKRLKGLGMIQKQGHWVPYELTGDRYRLQLMRLSRALKEKRPLYAQRHDKVILLHDNTRPHVAKPVKTYLETLKWEVLPHLLYSFLQRSSKMDRFLDRLKRHVVFPTRDSCTARNMVKSSRR